MATTWMIRICKNCKDKNLPTKYNTYKECACCGVGLDYTGGIISPTIREQEVTKLLWHAMELIKEYNKVIAPEYEEYMKYTNKDEFIKSLQPFTKGIIEKYNQLILHK